MEYQKILLKEGIPKCTLDFVTSESIASRMIKYFISLWWLCLVVIDASTVAAPSRGVPDILSACARMDIWGLSEVAKALCGAACCYKNCAVGTFIESQERLACSCSRCAPDTDGGIDCALCEKRWNQQRSKTKQRLTFKKVFSFIHNNIFFKNRK